MGFALSIYFLVIIGIVVVLPTVLGAFGFQYLRRRTAKNFALGISVCIALAAAVLAYAACDRYIGHSVVLGKTKERGPEGIMFLSPSELSSLRSRQFFFPEAYAYIPDEAQQAADEDKTLACLFYSGNAIWSGGQVRHIVGRRECKEILGDAI